MAIQDVIKRLIWQFSSTGADQVAADMGKVSDEQQKLAVNSENTTKASLDLEASFDKLERRFDTTIKAQQDYAKVQDQVNAAVAQHPELQARANNVLEQAAAKFSKAGEGADAYSKLLDKGRESLAGFAAEGGPVGALLGSFGPWGVAAAAGIGLVTKAMDYMKEESNKFGDSSAALKTFSENAGLTITQLRGVTEAGAGFGLSADKVGSAMQKFTANLGAAREGSGALYDGLSLVDKGLADEVAEATSTAQAFDIVAKAITAATDATTKINIARAAFGKGGAAMVGVAQETVDAGGLNAYSDAAEKASGVSSELMERVAQLRIETKALAEENEKLAQSMFAEQMQQNALNYQKIVNAIEKSILNILKNPGVGAGGELQPFSFAAPQGAAGGGAGSAAGAADNAARMDNAAALKAEQDAIEALTQSREADTAEMIKAASESSKMVAALGSFATAAEKAQAEIDALDVALNKGTISPEQYSRAADEIRRMADQVTAVGQAWGNVSEKTAMQLQTMKNNLPVAQAVGGAAKMQAQYQADINNALQQGKSLTEATALADANRAQTQAQINAGAKETLFNLQNQAGAAAAVTGAEKIMADAEATYNKLLHDGVDELIAAAVAAQQEANARAAATANIERQTHAIDQQTDMIIAQANGYGAAERAAQAYSNAIDSGASSASAMAQKTAILTQESVKAALAARQVQAAWNAANDAYDAAEASFLKGYDSFQSTWQTSYTGSSALTPGGEQLYMAAQSQADMAANAKGFSDQVAAAGASGVGAALAFAMSQQAHPAYFSEMGGVAPGGQILGTGQKYEIAKAVSEQDIISQVSSLYGTMNQQTQDKAAQAANLQAEMAWLQSRPESIAKESAIASLQQSMDQLTTSTDNLNATNQDLLSPYYTQDPRTSHIGFRSQGMAAGGYVDVPGGYSANDNMIASIPVASGERIYVDPMTGRRGMSGGNLTINISSPVMITGNANKDDVGRTMFQNNQNLAKQLRGAM